MDVHLSEMKAWAKENIVGVENVTFPSFSPDLSELDEDGIRHDVQQAIKHGFFATLCAAESGLTFDETKRFVAIVADEAKGKLTVGTTLLFDSIEKNIAMARHAEEAGCQSLTMGFPPNFYPHDVDEIFRAGKTMIEASNLAISIYPSPHFNFERFHHSGYPPELLDRFADFPNVVACKVGEPGLAAEIQSRVGDRLLVSNPVERMLPLMWQANRQQYIGAGCYEAYQSPDKPYMVDYYRKLREGKTAEAMEIYWFLTPVRVIFEAQHMPTAMLGNYNWPLQKYYQWLVGGNGGYTRQPTMKIHQHVMEPFKFALMQIGIDPHEPDEEFYYGRMNFEKIKSGKLKTPRAF